MKKFLSIFALLLVLTVAITMFAACDEEVTETPTETPTEPVEVVCTHEYDNSCDASCNLCGEKRITEHTVVDIPAVAATCTKAGLTAGTKCSVCNVIIKSPEVVALTAHTVVDADDAVAPTCTESGLTATKKCSVCNTVVEKQKTVYATGHKTEVVKGTDATCTTDGKTDGEKCTICGAITLPHVTIPGGHAWVAVPEKAATCTEKGNKAGRECAVCGFEEIEYTDIIDHTAVDFAEIPATCTQVGYTNGTMCSVCGEILTGNETTPALGHKEVDLAAVEPTCTENGLGAGKQCSVCGVVTEAQEVIPSLKHPAEHREDMPGKAPSCTSIGYVGGVKCTLCDTVIVAPTVVPAKHHIAPPCSDVCSVCGYPVTPESDHVFDSECDTMCNLEGCTYTRYTGVAHTDKDTNNLCDICGEIVDKNCKHTSTHEVSEKPASCLENGNTAGLVCDACGQFVEGEIIWATGHINEVVPGHAPTCEGIGFTDGKRCTVCQQITLPQQEIPATGHTEKAVDKIEPSCSVGYEAGIICDVCKKVLEGREEIPAVHDWSGDCDTTCNGKDCDATRESATEHTGKDGNADDYDTACAVCNEGFVSPTTPIAILKATYQLENNTTLAGGKYTLTGVITDISGEGYSTQYKNITFTIVVDGNNEYPIECYRAKGDGADILTVGDTVTVTGTLKDYNGKKEFDSGCTIDSYTKHTCTYNTLSNKCDICGDVTDHTHADANSDELCDKCGVSVKNPVTPEEIVEAAYALEKGATLNDITTGDPLSVTLTGLVISSEGYNASYSNITFVIQVGDMADMPITCYRAKGDAASTLVVGDTVTVTGAIKNYNGTIEFDTGCTIDSIVVHEHKYSGDCDTTCELCDYTRTVAAEHTDANKDKICDACGTNLSLKVSIDFSQQSYTNQQEISTANIGNIATIAFDKGSNSNASKYYNTGTAIRTYGGNIITISSVDGYSIEAISFTLSSGGGDNTISANVGTVDGYSWSGNATSVALTVSGTSGHIRIKKVEITYAQTGSAPSVTEDTNNYYLVGKGQGSLAMQGESGWTHEEYRRVYLTKSTGNVYTLTAGLYAGDEFKICWLGNWDASYGINNLTIENADGVLVGSGENFKVADGKTGIYKLTLTTNPDNTSENKLTYERIGDVEQHAYYVLGSFNNWTLNADAASEKMTDNGDGTWSITMTVEDGTQFKVVYGTVSYGAATWYGDSNNGGNNFAVDAGTYKITFNTATGTATYEAATVEVGPTTLTTNMTTYATAQGWTAGNNGGQHLSNELDSVITMTIAGGSNSGKYYEDNSVGNIRIYATDTPSGSVTISAAEGYTIQTVKITTVTGTYAFLQVTGNDSQDLSNTVVTVNGSSITFNSVKNGSSGKQVRITEIEVVYSATQA